MEKAWETMENESGGVGNAEKSGRVERIFMESCQGTGVK